MKTTFSYLSLVIACLLIIFSCKKDPPKVLPTLSTTEVSNITSTTATAGGTISSDGNTVVTARGVCWSNKENPTISNNITSDKSGIGTFSSSITELSPGKNYFVRAYATNIVGTAYGNQLIFTTTSVLPILTTTELYELSSTTATGGGNITSDGGAAVTARGVCWSINQNPTTKDSLTVNGMGTGIFTSSLTKLLPGSTYYVRAYATNKKGTAYGNELQLNKNAGVPKVTTTGITQITTGNALVSAIITDDGGSKITNRGVSFSTQPEPTWTDKIEMSGPGSGMGGYTTLMKRLKPGTTYYVRAIAQNFIGTSYGDQVSFKTLEDAIVNIPDANFKRYCLENFDTNHDGEISLSEACEVTNIACWNRNISSLEGIQAFVNLKELNILGNQLTKLNISSNVLLKTLECYENNLTELNVSSNVLLEYLYCYGNQLTELNVSSNVSLKDLWCFENSISNLDVTHNLELTHLICKNNKLTSLDVSKNSLLLNLSFSHNNLNSIDISKNLKLRLLDCSYNPLLSLDLTLNTSLANLSCLGNNLKSLNTTNNTDLTTLVCSFNQLTSLDLSNNTLLKGLVCFVNNLTTLDVSHNPKLETLYCDANQLTSIDIRNNTKLVGFCCQQNMLSSLDITRNTELKMLWLGYNQLTSIDVSKNISLEEFKCFDNKLTSLDVSSNRALSLLYCDGNQISSLKVNNCTELTDLQCRENKLSSLDVSNNKIINTLWCQGNPNLTELFFYTGQIIRDLQKDSFTNIYYKQSPNIGTKNMSNGNKRNRQTIKTGESNNKYIINFKSLNTKR